MAWNQTVANFKNATVAPRACFIAGATGEVGRKLLHRILTSSAFDRVVVLTRRSLEYTGSNSRILEEHIVPDFDTLLAAAESIGTNSDFEIESKGEDSVSKVDKVESDTIEADDENGKGKERMDDIQKHVRMMEGCQYAFCCVGTTRNKAGSPEAFYKVDHDYIMALGKLAKSSGCRWFGVVSSAGASATSPFLYPKTKGETERDLATLELTQLCIYRPGFLMCKRQEWRLGEWLASWVMPAVDWISGGRAAIPSEIVAEAMLLDALKATGPVPKSPQLRIIPNKAMSDAVKLSHLDFH